MKKILGVISIFLGVELLVCFVVGFFMQVPYTVVKDSVFGFKILTSFELFIKFFPAVVMTAFVVSFAVYFGHNAEGSLTRFSSQMMKRFRYVMISTLIIAAAITINSEVFSNLIIMKKESIINQPKIINEYVKVGNNLFKNGYYERAIRYADAALKLSPNNSDAIKLRDKSDEEISRAQTYDIRSKLYSSVEEADKVDRVDIDPEQISAVYDYYLKAQDAFDKEEWFNAHYFAELGIKIATAKDPNFDKLKTLSTEAWQNLEDCHKLSKTEEQKIFEKKYEGYLALIQHDDLKAYYIFRELYHSSRELKRDPDVVFYMEIAEDRINQRSFFIDETLELESFESANDIYFSYEYADGSVDIFYCKGMTIVEETGDTIQYLRDLTITSVDRFGNFYRTMRVPYAKVLPVLTETLSRETKELLGIDESIEFVPYIILKSVGRDMPNKEVLPKYTYNNGSVTRSPEHLLLPLAYKDFLMLEKSAHTPETIPLLTLYKLAFNASNFGYSTEVFAQVFMNRIYFPLWIIIIFILLATFAWHNRINPDGYFKFTWIFSFPLFFIASVLFYKCMLFVYKLVNYAILSRMSVGSAFVMAGVMYLICYILVSIQFLGSRSKQ